MEKLESLIRGYSNSLYRVLYRLLWNKEDAEEALQETFIKCWSKLKGSGSDPEIKSLVYRIAVNTAIDHLRRNRRRLSDIEFVETIHAGSGDADVQADEMKKFLIRESQRLSVAERAVFTLVELENFSIRETASILKKSDGTVRTTLSNLRKSLRRALEEEYGE